MNEMTTRLHARSVQLAVLAAPSSSIADAVAEARRRRDAATSPASGANAGIQLRFEVAGT
jgi:hypothetical protein